jgi:maltooligosyltrehalose trehalohydrolase
MTWQLPLGAQPHDDGTTFRVWAPDRTRVEVVRYDENTPGTAHPLERDNEGYWTGHVAALKAGALYKYRLDSHIDRPDPASRHQPLGVHGPSMVIDPRFAWTDDGWKGVPRASLVVYELHVGTATTAGTFDALIEHLAELRDLGVTAIELLPVADFPGDRNWGYDGVDLYAPARAYGGANALKRLIDAAHGVGLGVIMDVVYNHLGPSGNYLRDFAQGYFTGRHHTPWGEALNYDGAASRPVREFFIDNALYWAHEYHIDGLRLDATHAIIDDSPVHVLQELAERVRSSLPPDRHFVIMAEDGRNEAALARPISEGGLGLDGIWADDFHHVVRVTLTGEQEGYYRYYKGGSEELAATLREGWLYAGQSPGQDDEPRGTPARDLPPSSLVYCIQNHDQIGNRAFGERLNHDVPLDAYRAASALLLLSPFTPMLYMGQEWAASTPFLFFTDHDEELGRLVTAGRRKEFEHFSAFAGEQVPDPQARDTFERSKLVWEERAGDPHRAILRLYRDLLAIRHRFVAYHADDRALFDVQPFGTSGVMVAVKDAGNKQQGSLIVAVNLLGQASLDLAAAMSDAPSWDLLLDTEDPRYGGAANQAPPYMRRVGTDEGTAIHFEGPRAIVLASGV